MYLAPPTVGLVIQLHRMQEDFYSHYVNASVRSRAIFCTAKATSTTSRAILTDMPVFIGNKVVNSDKKLGSK
jgi:hypothetical protein